MSKVPQLLEERTPIPTAARPSAARRLCADRHRRPASQSKPKNATFRLCFEACLYIYIHIPARYHIYINK